LEVKSPLRPIAIRIWEYRLAWPWRSLSGSKMGDLIDLGAGALQNVGAAVDHRVQQFHQHHFARYPGHA